MKVIHYWPHFFYLESSGPGNSILGWARALARIGVETLLVGDETAVRIDPPRDLDYVFVKHVGRGHFRVPVQLPISVREDSVLVTHGGWTLTNVVAGMHARRRRVPYIVMPHAVYDPRALRRRALSKRVWFSTLEKPYLEKATAIHVFFPDERAHLESLGVASSVIVAPNGIETPNGVQWDGGSGGYVLWLGRYDPQHKGLDILLQGMSLLPEADRPQLRLHGRDYHGGRSVVERLCRELSLQASVSIEGPIYGDEKWRLMSEALGFVHPSRWEGSSIAIAEAISIGTPTLVAGFAMGRFLASRGGAILVDMTPSGVKGGIELLLSDEATERGARGSEIARNELSWDVVARSWVEQVEAVLAGRAR